MESIDDADRPVGLASNDDDDDDDESYETMRLTCQMH